MTEHELRDDLAKSAPNEIPSWFKGVEPEKIESPAYYADEEYNDHPTKNEMRKWHLSNGPGGSFQFVDIDTKGIEDYVRKWTNYWKETYESERKAKEETYFKWRYYYADQMIKERRRWL